MRVLKKDGIRVEEFNPIKIKRAVNLASGRLNTSLNDSEMEELISKIQNVDVDIIPVSELHGLVIHHLQNINKDVAESYKSYRGYKLNFNKTFSKILQSTREVLDSGDKENANKNSELVSTKKEITSGIVSKHLALDYELPQDLAVAHKEGYIHIHDLTDEIYGSINCCLFDMSNVLKDGYTINGVEMREPKHLSTAMSVISDIILSASSNQFGGFTVPEIDKVLSPYVANTFTKMREELLQINPNLDADTLDKMVEDRVFHMLCESFENLFDHRLNTINNANGQTSFTTLTFGLETTREGRLVNKAILTSRLKGIGKNKITAIFPKLVFLHRNEINGLPDSPNYDIKQLAIECSMKRMYPDWLSLDEGYLKRMYDKYKQVVSPMGCRAYLSLYVNEKGEAVFTGRANCGAVSINLPRLALESKSEEQFLSKVVDYVHLAVKKHEYKFNKLRGVKASANPLFFVEGGCHIKLQPNDTIEEAIKTFTWSIGYIGIDEVTRYFRNCGVHEDNTLGIQILETIQAEIDKLKVKTGLRLALYSTPSESLCYRFLLLDKEKFGKIEGVTDKEYYTNSFHVWVKEGVGALDKQDIEKPMFDIAEGGRIVYNEFPHTHNKKAIEQCINYAMSQGLYYGVNLQLDSCSDCATEGEFTDTICPSCGGSNIISINRVCGYLGYSVVNNDTRFNKGKLAEKNERVDHFNN